MKTHVARALPALGLSVFITTIQAEQVCHDAVAPTTPDSRFQDNRNGTITDLATGLLWKQCVEGLNGTNCTTGRAQTLTWQQALERAEEADVTGSDWRLPNKKELASLVERSCYSPSINARHFPNTPSGWFWSSTPHIGLPNDAWYISFSSGSGYSGHKDFNSYVRLVGK